MEILHEINPALEALAYLGSRANGHTLDRLEERLQARGVRKAEPFHRASAALRELLQDLDTEVSVPAETLQRLFGDIKGFSYSTIGSYSPAFLFFYPMLSRRQDFETLMQQMERLTPDETARNMMISLSLEEQSGPAAGAAAKLVSRVLALTIPTESRLALLEIHQNYRTLLPEIAACLRPAIAALETESGRIQEIIEAFCREVEGLGDLQPGHHAGGALSPDSLSDGTGYQPLHGAGGRQRADLLRSYAAVAAAHPGGKQQRLPGI